MQCTAWVAERRTPLTLTYTHTTNLHVRKYLILLEWQGNLTVYFISEFNVKLVFMNWFLTVKSYFFFSSELLSYQKSGSMAPASFTHFAGRQVCAGYLLFIYMILLPTVSSVLFICGSQDAFKIIWSTFPYRMVHLCLCSVVCQWSICLSLVSLLNWKSVTGFNLLRLCACPRRRGFRNFVVAKYDGG